MNYQETFKFDQDRLIYVDGFGYPVIPTKVVINDTTTEETDTGYANNLNLVGGASGHMPTLTAATNSSDTNVDIYLEPKGTGTVIAKGDIESNYRKSNQIKLSTTTNTATIQAQGTDSYIDLYLKPQGNGTGVVYSPNCQIQSNYGYMLLTNDFNETITGADYVTLNTIVTNTFGTNAAWTGNYYFTNGTRYPMKVHVECYAVPDPASPPTDGQAYDTYLVQFNSSNTIIRNIGRTKRYFTTAAGQYQSFNCTGTLLLAPGDYFMWVMVSISGTLTLFGNGNTTLGASMTMIITQIP